MGKTPYLESTHLGARNQGYRKTHLRHSKVAKVDRNPVCRYTLLGFLSIRKRFLIRAFHPGEGLYA